MTAWESIPKFIRFTVWLYAIGTVISFILFPITLLLIAIA